MIVTKKELDNAYRILATGIWYYAVKHKGISEEELEKMEEDDIKKGMENDKYFYPIVNETYHKILLEIVGKEIMEAIIGGQ